jgi:uncharacterized OB-fold protein
MILPRFDPPSIEMATPFWDGVAVGELRLPRCSVCDRWQWYPEAEGTDCTGGTLRWVRVPHTGTLYSHTTVHRSFLPGGREHVPYTIGMIDLDGVEGPRLVANLGGGTYAVGDRVTASFVALGARRHLVFVHDQGDPP